MIALLALPATGFWSVTPRLYKRRAGRGHPSLVCRWGRSVRRSRRRGWGICWTGQLLYPTNGGWRTGCKRGSGDRGRPSCGEPGRRSGWGVPRTRVPLRSMTLGAMHRASGPRLLDPTRAPRGPLAARGGLCALSVLSFSGPSDVHPHSDLAGPDSGSLHPHAAPNRPILLPSLFRFTPFSHDTPAKLTFLAPRTALSRSPW